MTIPTLLTALLHCISPLASPGMLAGSVTRPHAHADLGAVPEGKPFTAPEAGFSLVLPSGFSTPERMIEPPGGSGDDIHYAATAERGFCTIAVMKLPRVLMVDSVRRRMVDDAMQSTLEGMGRERKMTVTSVSPTTVAGRPGRSALMTITTNKQTMKGRLDVCINDDRVYELLLMTTDGTSPDRAEVRDVFASFSLFTIDPKARPAAPATEGERFIAKEGGFSVILPTGSTQPEVNSQSVPSIGADAKLYRYTADNAEGTYMLITSPLPMEPVTEADRADLIARILENQLRSLNAAPGTEATVSSQRDTTLGGIAHHIVILSTRSEGQTQWQRLDFILVSSRLYQMIAVLPSKDALVSEELERYFGSFALVPQHGK